MSSVEIRQFELSDTQAAVTFLDRVSNDFPIPLNSRVDLATYCKKMLDYGIVLGAYTDDGVIIGVAGGYANDEERLTAFLSVIAVDGLHRSTGAAAILLAAFEDAARQRGMHTLALKTHHTNLRSQRFYRKHGYVIGETLDETGDIDVFKLLAGITPERPNILLTSVGRRGYLVEWFKDAMKGKGNVLVTNSQRTPAFNVADGSAISPPIYSDEYISFLISFIKENHVGAMLSLFDIDIPVLAKNRERFVRCGCFPVVASYATAMACNDKFMTYESLKAAGIKTVETYLGAQEFSNAVREGRVTYPAVVKPRWGMGSLGIMKVDDESELLAACSMVSRTVEQTYLKYESSQDAEHNVIIQSQVQGEEYGIDVMNGLDGGLKGFSARKKLAMRAGETDIAETVMGDSRFEDLAQRISRAFSFPGNMDVDAFDINGDLHVLEMNARFGGGYPFSHMAGVNLPEALLCWLSGADCEEEVLTPSSPGLFAKQISIVRV